ncbi:DUF434 domain-containing protein [uncultured Methanomethylovorans sp.]|uniref:DUF434 domain-containing protein n=1 Tax=uncultured Methanomethylovorans sp. TaxID=183759 RepID=UPI002AA6F2EC|nr:DUF434 domain-containing protein [uncultured Methanomethylovorans sp.]
MQGALTENVDSKISKLSLPARDIRYLLEKGYSKTSSIRFVCDHYHLEKNERNVLTRVIISPNTAIARNKKRLTCKEVAGKKILVDGYNVLIAIESMLECHTLWLCDDGFVRDTRGVFRSHNNTDITIEAVKRMCSTLSKFSVPYVKVLLDSQMSQSGELAVIIRQEMVLSSLQGEVSTSAHADFDLKNAGSEYVIATADGVIIDAVEKIIDLPAAVIEEKGIWAEMII